jgi:hypothetical protein
MLHTVSMTKNGSMLARELIAVYCENHTNAGFLNFKAGDISRCRWALKG